MKIIIGMLILSTTFGCGSNNVISEKQVIAPAIQTSVKAEIKNGSGKGFAVVKRINSSSGLAVCDLQQGIFRENEIIDIYSADGDKIASGNVRSVYSREIYINITDVDVNIIQPGFLVFKNYSIDEVEDFLDSYPQSVVSATGSITFDDFSQKGFGFVSADRYSGQGIVFDRDIPVYDISIDPAFFLDRGGTLPNAMALALPSRGLYKGAGLSIDLSFVLPVTSTPATTNFFQATFFDTEVGSTLGTLQAFNASGVLLDSNTMITPSSKYGILQVSAPGIARVRISVDSDGAFIDNLQFDTPLAPSRKFPR